MTKTIKIIIGVSILGVLALAIVTLLVMKNVTSSLDGPSLILIDALDQDDYKKAEQSIHQGADVNFAMMGISILHQSVTENDIADADFLIKHGADVNTRSKSGRSPLHVAALYGHYDIAKLLIEAGANVNARNPRGETPLFYAEEGLLVGPPHTPMNDKVAELLKSYGATR